MKALKFALVLAFAGSAHAGWGDGLDALFSDIPVQGDPEPADADFDFSNWLEAGDFTLAPDEPVVLVSSAARATAAPEAEQPIANDGGLCRGAARIEDKQRDRVVRRYVREVLKTGSVRDPGQRIEDCMVRYTETLSTALRLDCLDLTPEAREGTVLLDGFAVNFSKALDLCATVGTITDKQISDAFAQMLRGE